MNTRITTQYFTSFEASAPLVLESGVKLGPITTAYETYGNRNESSTNIILVCHPLTGDAHAAFESESTPHDLGWWDKFIGPGKAIDTDRFFVICANTLGSCKGSTGPSSIKPSTGQPYGTQFPVITIGDMVKVQKKLLDHLEITDVQLVIGGSMGGMMALEWVAQYPDLFRACIPVATTAQVSPQAVAFDAVSRHAIVKDEHFNKGAYYNNTHPNNGLSIARMIGHITYLSETSLSSKFGRKLQSKSDYGYDFEHEFQVESYLQYQGNKFVDRFDANSYLYLTKAISYFDIPKKYGSIEAALEKSTCRFLIIAISSDWLYPAKESKAIASGLLKLNKRVSYVEINSQHGHDAFLLNNSELMKTIKTFLETL